jgi:hypothetical protein
MKEMRFWRRAHAVCWVLILLWIGVSATARAQSSDETAAEALFLEGRRLMEQKLFDQACAKFSASYKVDAGIGTLLNLASCHAAAGRTATAWTLFREAASLATKQNDARRKAFAAQRADDLEPKLVRLMIVVPQQSRAVGLRVQRGGVLVAETSWGTAVPVDPGTHHIEARAPGKRPWGADVTAGSDGAVVRVEVPPLEKDPTAHEERGRAPSNEAIAPSPRESSSTQRILGYIVGGVGLVGLGVGTGFVFAAKATWDDARERCPEDGSRCDSAGVELGEQARSKAQVASFAFIAGALAIGTGAVLVLTAPPSRSDRPSARARQAWVRVETARDAASVVMQGRF